MKRSATLLCIALAVPLCVAPAARADTQYGGTALHNGSSPANPTIALIRRDDGRVDVRMTMSVNCKGYGTTSQVLRASGRLNGASLDVRARSRIRGMGTITIRLEGTVADTSATGEARVRIASCLSYRRPFVLRTESAPAGAPAVPGPGTVMQGFSSQSGGGFRMPLVLRVAKNGRVFALWNGLLQCARGRLTMLDLTPSRAIRPDGTFGGSETYTVRYRGGYRERYRVTFRGQFLADGARGTVTARLQSRDGRIRYKPCRTGAQTWAARAT